MAILNRFICSKHGEFDAWSDDAVRCPKLKCRCKPRQMVSGPSIRTSTRTADMDKTLTNLASDYNMTNIKSTKEGDNQAGYFTRNNATKPAEPRPGDSVMWGNTGSFSMQNIMGGGAFKSVRGESVSVKPTDVGVKRGPTTASYVADHENLKIDK